MYPISPIYDEYLRRRAREWIVKADINGEEYDSSSIVDFSIENSIISGQEFEIGTAIAAKMVIRIKSASELPSNAKIIPYLSLTTAGLTWNDASFAWDDADISWDGSNTAWLPMGEYYVDRREKINSLWVYTCYDKLMLANIPYVSSLNYPATMKAIWDEICNRIGYSYDNSVIINPAYTVPVAPTGYSMRQVLGFIAGANCASIFAGKDGVLRFKRFSASEQAVFEMTTADYIRVKQLNPVKSYSRVVVTYDEEDQLTYEAGSGDENHTLTIFNPLMTQAMTNDIRAQLNGFSYVPIQMDARGYPQLDVGDSITYLRQESIPWDDADLAWDQMELTWDGLSRYQTLILEQTFVFKGGLTLSLQAPSKSEQQSEFQVEGSLTQQVNRLTQNAVRQGKNYYGVTISKDFGLRIDRSDGKARADLNADELSFWAGNQRALWFDVPNLRWKFKGTLEGVDGTFSGTVSAATIIGSTINGGIINGTSIIGVLISGSTIQTDSPGTYPRAEMSNANKMFRVETASNSYVEVRAFGSPVSSPIITLASGGMTSQIAPSSNPNVGLYFSGDTTTFEFDHIYLRGFVGVHFNSWSSMINDASGQTLQQALNAKANASVYSGSVTVDGRTFNISQGVITSVT